MVLVLLVVGVIVAAWPRILVRQAGPASVRTTTRVRTVAGLVALSALGLIFVFGPW